MCVAFSWIRPRRAGSGRTTRRSHQRGRRSRRTARSIARAFGWSLEALETEYRTVYSEPIVLRGTLTVEHLLPQTWQDTWPLPAGVDPKESTRAARRPRAPVWESDPSDEYAESRHLQ